MRKQSEMPWNSPTTAIQKIHKHQIWYKLKDLPGSNLPLQSHRRIPVQGLREISPLPRGWFEQKQCEMSHASHRKRSMAACMRNLRGIGTNLASCIIPRSSDRWRWTKVSESRRDISNRQLTTKAEHQHPMVLVGYLECRRHTEPVDLVKFDLRSINVLLWASRCRQLLLTAFRSVLVHQG